MSRCVDFYAKVEREGTDWCEKVPESVRQIENYMDLVAQLEKKGISKETTIVGLAEGAARPLFAIRDMDLREKCISSVQKSLELKKDTNTGRFSKRVAKKDVEKIISDAVMAPRRENLILRGKDVMNDPETISFHCGDFLTDYEKIPAGSVDCIITDPPYIGEWAHNYDAFAKAACHVLKPSGFLISYMGQFHAYDFETALRKYFIPYWPICLYQTDPNKKLLQVRNVICDYKPILVMQKPPYARGKNIFHDVIIGGGREKTDHEWQQGLEEIRPLFNAFTDVGDVVLDPFCGSGTVLVMAKMMNRRGIGWDIIDQNVGVAKGRLAELTSA